LLFHIYVINVDTAFRQYVSELVKRCLLAPRSSDLLTLLLNTLEVIELFRRAVEDGYLHDAREYIEKFFDNRLCFYKGTVACSMPWGCNDAILLAVVRTLAQSQLTPWFADLYVTLDLSQYLDRETRP
jgi:hypothetical protein